MSTKPAKGFDKLSERSLMSSLAEAQELIQKLAEPSPRGDRVKAAIERVRKILPNAPHWTYSRVKTLWYADARCSVSSVEMDELREAARARKLAEAAEATRKRKEASDHATEELRREIEKIREVLERIAPEEFRRDIGSLRRSADRLG